MENESGPFDNIICESKDPSMYLPKNFIRQVN
jgi:hypothetical protein